MTARRSGFTLLEVLVALAIFAMTAIILSSAYLNVLNSYAAAGRANRQNLDVSFAREQLLAEPDRAKVEEGAEFDSLDNRHVRWSATITPTTMPDLFTVAFTCEITDAAEPDLPKITETFTVLRPTWSDPAENGPLQLAVQERIAEIQGKKPR